MASLEEIHAKVGCYNNNNKVGFHSAVSQPIMVSTPHFIVIMKIMLVIIITLILFFLLLFSLLCFFLFLFVFSLVLGPALYNYSVALPFPQMDTMHGMLARYSRGETASVSILARAHDLRYEAQVTNSPPATGGSSTGSSPPATGHSCQPSRISRESPGF